jgi:anti-sigma28 factor (negative regulator of flagellin synthesis)
MLKIKIEFEIEENELQEIFESYNIKFTKKKVTELKKAIKDGEIDLTYEVEDDIKSVLGDAIDSMFGE